MRNYFVLYAGYESSFVEALGKIILHGFWCAAGSTGWELNFLGNTERKRPGMGAGELLIRQ